MKIPINFVNISSIIIKLSLNKLPPLGSALVASQMNTKTNHPKNANENKLFNVPVPKNSYKWKSETINTATNTPRIDSPAINPAPIKTPRFSTSFAAITAF